MNIITYTDNGEVTPGVSGVPLFGYFTKNINPASLLEIIDTAAIIPENNPQYNRYEAVSGTFNGGSGFLLPDHMKGHASGHLIVTDISTKNKYSDDAVPLFYQYQMLYNHYADDTVAPDDVMVIRKNNESTIIKDGYQIERRDYLVASGRYVDSSAGEWTWGGVAGSSNIGYYRILLPARSNRDNFYTVEYNKNYNNVTSEKWFELIDEKPLYTESSDYTITPSSVELVNGSLIEPSSVLYIQKNPESFIHINYPNSISDKYKELKWNFSVNLGNVLLASGISGEDYINYIAKKDTGYDQSVADEKAEFVSNNIVRVAHHPIVSTTSTSPPYDYTNSVQNFFINGVNHVSGILSIDAGRGYVHTERTILRNSETTLMYRPDGNKIMEVKNVQLNPTQWESGDLVDVAEDGIGIALIPSGSASVYSTTEDNFTGIAFYKLSDSSGVLGDFSSNNITSYLASHLTTNAFTGIIPSGSKFIGSISAKMTPKENIDMVDIRRTGGWNEEDIIVNSSGWRGYSDIGFYDGEAFPMAGTVLVQVPSGIYDNIYNIFEKDDAIAVEAGAIQDTTNSIDKNNNTNLTTSDVVKEYTDKYIRDTIERYIPYGMKYVLVDQEMNEWEGV